RAVFGLFPASSVGDDIQIYPLIEKNESTSCDRHGSHQKVSWVENRKEVLARLHMLRTQRQMEEASSPNTSLADSVAPLDSGKQDYVGAFCVTAGIGLDELCKNYEKDQDDYSSILVKSLADRLAEAFAE